MGINNKKCSYSIYILTIVLLFVVEINSQITERYRIIDLGTFGVESYATGINNKGHVVGYSRTSGSNIWRGFIWKGDSLIDLGDLGNDYTWASAINDSDEVTGHSVTVLEEEIRAFRWKNGTMTNLGSVGGNASYGYAINNSGAIVGESIISDSSIFSAFLWNGGMVNLGIDSVYRSAATGINNSGKIIGWNDALPANVEGWLLDGVIINLGHLGGSITWPRDINDDAAIVGASRTSNNEVHAFLWENGVMTDLGGVSSGASSINSSGEIVGSPAFIYKDGEMKNLNDLISSNSGWTLHEANDINDDGWIVGNGYFNGQQRAFLLIPLRYPVLIVPGIAGTYSEDTENDLGWIMYRGVPPALLQIDPLGKVYHDIIKTFENIGYEKGKDLFVVNYDWRLVPGPDDNNINGHIDGLTGASITDNQFNYGVDYLGWYMKEACDKWREEYGIELDSIDVIAHSTGGLVTRTYIQSNAYGDFYSGNYKLPVIRNFVMMGVPNRGASKAWNAIHDNWIADPVYRFVLSKILNSAYQKILRGGTVNGPDYDITLSSIQDSLGNPSKIIFINKYVPTLRGLLATYDFIDFGNGYTNVNSDTAQRNSFLLDLNNGYDLYPNANPNDFLDAAKVSVVYGTGKSTFDLVEKRDDFEINAVQSFTDWTRSTVLGGTIWYKDLASGGNNGDETVPIVSSAGQFLNDSRAVKYPFSVGDHTSMMSNVEVQSTVLDILNVDYEQNNISTGTSPGIRNVLNVIVDPVESIITDGGGNRLGYSNTTGTLTEIPNSIWFGNTDGRGWVFDSVQEPINLQLTGLGEDYYVMVSVEDSGRGGGVVLEGFLALGEVINYQITLDPLSVDQINSSIPDKFELAQNYPNPFNPKTTIQFSIPQRSRVILKVYDILGNELATLVNEEKNKGVYSVNFDASQLASGLYLYRIQAGSFVETKKMILIK